MSATSVKRPGRAGARRGRPPAMARGFGWVLARVWFTVAAIALWEWYTKRKDDMFFPPPSTIVKRMREVWFSGPADHLFLTPEATGNFFPSLGRLITGWLLAALLGIVLGVALGRSRRISDYVDPLLQFGRAIPAPALVPVFIVFFKIGTPMQLATIVFGVVWPVLLNAIDGAREVDPLQVDTTRVFGMTAPLRLRYLILPAAAPKIFAGLRLSLSLSLILMVLSEMVGSTNGIGYRLLISQREFDYGQMWAGIVLLGILGYVLNVAFLAVERRALGWHAGARRSPG